MQCTFPDFLARLTVMARSLTANPFSRKNRPRPQCRLPFAATDYLGEFCGARFRRIVAELQKRHGDVDPGKLDSMETHMRANLATRLSQECRHDTRRPRSTGYIGWLPQRRGIQRPKKKKIHTALSVTGLGDYFGNRLFSGYTANCWKPEPCLHLHAASIMGYLARDCIAIDDALVGVHAAQQAGMTVIHLNRFPDAETTPENAIMISNMCISYLQ